MSSQIRGILFMASASAIIPVADGIAKVLSENHSALLVSSGRYFAASILLLPIAFMKHGRKALPPRHRLKPHIMRTILMVMAMTLFYVSIVTIDLATAVSAFFVGPIVGSVAAVFLLGEKMTKAKLVALGLGFVGAIIIARPGTAMSPGVLLALAAGVCYGFYLVSTRLRRNHAAAGAGLPERLRHAAPAAAGHPDMVGPIRLRDHATASHGCHLAGLPHADHQCLPPCGRHDARAALLCRADHLGHRRLCLVQAAARTHGLDRRGLRRSGRAGADLHAQAGFVSKKLTMRTDNTRRKGFRHE